MIHTLLLLATFTNPLLDSGPDPYVTTRDGYYYYTATTGKNLTLWKTRDLTKLRDAEKKVVWTPPAEGPYSRQLWAPELHFFAGKWYIYFAADDGENAKHRMYVVENPSPDPLAGTWTFKGKAADPTGKWAIDATVFENRGTLYMVWSGWEGDTNVAQNLYIARMSNPWTIEGQRVRISTPEFAWERGGGPPYVNEGPAVLRHDGTIFLAYSASGCWTDDYELGLLSNSGKGDLLDAAQWHKSPQPVFTGSPEAQAFGPGHNSFFQSPDGKEDWILYHANPGPKQGCGGKRSPRAQRIEWRKDGTPDFGHPVPLGTPLTSPTR